MSTIDDKDWLPMSDAPRDGSSFDVLCVGKGGTKVIARDLHYGHRPMGTRSLKSMILWGKHNFLSPYLTPIGWKPLTARTKEEQEKNVNV